MAENITTRLGERGMGSNFKATCPRGGHITGFYGYMDSLPPISAYRPNPIKGKFITSIGTKCSDGSDLGQRGRTNGYAPTSWEVNQETPFYNFSGAYTTMGTTPTITKFMGNGTMDGTAWSSSCPSGVALGIYGTASEYINSYGLECGVPINYCMKNLEDPACADIDDDNLNKACSLNFTKTCFEKKDSLEPETIKAYCKANPTNSICPKSMASYIPNSDPTDPNGVYTRPPMPSDIASTSNILILLVVVVFGGVIAFMLLKDKPAKSTSSQKPQTQQSYNQQPTQQYYQQPQAQPYYQQPQAQPYYQQPQAQQYYQPPPRG
jgi:hypothetical protein